MIPATQLEIVKQLEETRDRMLKYFELGEADLAKTYGPGKWSVRFVLHHLSESEAVFNDRLRRIICQPRGVIWAYDQDAFAAGLDYARMPLELSRRIYEAARPAIIHLAREHYGKDGAREFVHSETGVRTLKEEFDKVVWHNEQHLAQIEKALRS
jgi:hypothetical protein